MAKKPLSDKTICRNRKARFRYEIIERIECGLVLLGTEVKSLRAQSASLEEAFARIDDTGLWLVGFHIAAYTFGHTTNHAPMRPRKLLVHASELRRIRPKVEQRGFTLVPLSVYFNDRGIAKVMLAVARGKGHSDKRQALRERDHKREIERAVRRKR